MAAEIDAEPLPRRRQVHPEPSAREQPSLRGPAVRGQRRGARWRGAGLARVRARPRASRSPRPSWARACSPPDSPKALGSVGLQAVCRTMRPVSTRPTSSAIGYDLIKQSPETWNPRRDKRIICIDSEPAETDANFMPEVELVGDIYHVLTRLGNTGACRTKVARPSCARWCSGASSRPRTTTRSPCSRRARCGDPPGARPLRHPDLGRRAPQALDRPHVPRLRAEEHRPIAKRLRPGCALRSPQAVAELRPSRSRSVVTVDGDGSFLMNCRKFEPRCA